VVKLAAREVGVPFFEVVMWDELVYLEE